MTGALSNIRVLDLSRILAGPWCTQIFADLGAEVIKVERPGHGDDTRGWGPPFLHNEEGQAVAESAYFLAANRGKKSIAVDIAHPDGAEVVRSLVKHCDVLVENFKVGGLAKYGLDYASLRAVNPRIVYCSITGFGQFGPNAQQPGYDFMIQGAGGLMSITGEQDERPGGGPQKVGVAVADLMSGMYATVAVQAALLRREVSGEGQHIDLALFDVQVAMLANQAMGYLVSGEVPGRSGNAHPSIVPYQVFKTRDGHIVLAVGNDQQFARFCEIAGCAELAQDPRFNRNESRVRHRNELIPRLEKVFATKDSDRWLSSLSAASVPCGPINSVATVFDDPQVLERGMLWQAKHPMRESLPMVASPIKMSDTPARPGGAPPLLGEHTVQVLTETLGLGADQVERLLSEGVVAEQTGQ